MVLYIRFLFAYAKSDQNGGRCQAIGCAARQGPFHATVPTSGLPTNQELVGKKTEDLAAPN